MERGLWLDVTAVPSHTSVLLPLVLAHGMHTRAGALTGTWRLCCGFGRAVRPSLPQQES